MIEIKVQFDNIEQIRQAMERAPQLMVNEASKAVQKSLVVLHGRAVKEAPANKGISTGNTLRQRIRSRMVTRLRGVVESFAPYSIFVHEGTAPHLIVPVNKKVLANKRTGEIFGKRVNHPGTRPNPFLSRAVERSQSKINEFFATAINNVLKTLK